MKERAQLQRKDMTDKQYEAFSKACQFIYDMNMKYFYGNDADNEKEGNQMSVGINDSEKLKTLKELMRTVAEPLELLYGMMLVIDPVAVRIATQKVEASQ